MTTNITIQTNGNYVAEGSVVSEQTWEQGSVENYTRRVEEFKVGPGNMVAKNFSVNHGAEVVVFITERDATPEEIEATKVSV